VTFVLDNSVAMRWYFESAADPYADGILKRLAAGEDALVPVLWFYEASAVLSREQNRGILAAPKAEDLIAELQALRISADAESAARVFGVGPRFRQGSELRACIDDLLDDGEQVKGAAREAVQSASPSPRRRGPAFRASG
jgi:hypothetical protein